LITYSPRLGEPGFKQRKTGELNTPGADRLDADRLPLQLTGPNR
jgi:hypothetical protein